MKPTMLVPRTLSVPLLVCLVFCLATPMAQGQAWKIGNVHDPIRIPTWNPCASGMYDSDVFATASGGVTFLAQGGNLLQVCNPAGTAGMDALFAAQWSSATQAWTTPTETSCPNLRGFYFSSPTCPSAPYGPHGPTAPGPVGSPSVVKIGNRYFMAFVGGNADYILGRVHWASSSDGINWTVLSSNPPAGLSWRPIVDTEYWDRCQLYAGTGQVNLTYDPADTSMGPNGTFYLHFFYNHPFAANGFYAYDVLAYRFAYNPSDPNGFGLSSAFYSPNTQPGQMCIAPDQSEKAPCSWYPHSGRMVWDYDKAPVAVAGDRVLIIWNGMRQMGYGGGDVKYDPIHNNWIHVYQFGNDPNVIWQTTTSLASSLWTNPQVMDVSAFDAALSSRYPGIYQASERYGSSVFYGTLGNRTGLWLFQPADTVGCPNKFEGPGIVPAELCSGVPAVSSVSPASGPTSGGTSVTLSGANLDCVSSVTFGGTPGGMITSKSPTSLTVTTPARATGGAVTVAVTAPGGTGSLPNGFTYTAPPAPPVYEGFHEGLDCNNAWGWAWDMNRPNTPIPVTIFDGTTQIATVMADVFRQDLLNAGKGNGAHGFGFALPSSVRNGSAHSISVKFESSSTLLGWSPRSINCRSLTITKASTGSGTVSSNPAGISCGSDCSEWYPVNTNVSLSATPITGTFSGWSGAGCGATVTMSANLNCTATFTTPPPTARVIWMQPQAMAGFGTPGSLVMAGSASGAPPGTTVRVTWRNVTLNGAWITEPWQPTPDANGIWYHEIRNANTSQRYAVYATYGTTTSATCTYPGNGSLYWCP